MEQSQSDLTELRLGLPGTTQRTNNKRAFSPEESNTLSSKRRAQVVGWPPVRSYRKNSLHAKTYVKVSVDGAPYLRKIDLNAYECYSDLLQALQNMFKLSIGEYSEREGYNGSDYAPTYQDKDGDWMLVGDVPFHIFIGSCKRLRIIKGSEARGLTNCL